MLFEIAEGGAQRDVLLARQILVAEKENAVLEQSRAQCVIGRPVERPREVDATDQRAEARLQGSDVEELRFGRAI